MFLVCAISTALLFSGLTISGGQAEKRSSRADSVTINSITLPQCPRIDGKYAQGLWSVHVNFTVSSEITNAKVSVDVDGGDPQETPMAVPYAPGDYEEVPGELSFGEAGTYTINAKVTYAEGGPATKQLNLDFQDVYNFSISNIAFPESAESASGEYGKIMHRVSVDISNDGNVPWYDGDTLKLNLSIESGGMPEDLNGAVILSGTKCPTPGNTTSLKEQERYFEWLPSKEGSFDLTVTATDSRGGATDPLEKSVTVKNATSIDISDLNAPNEVSAGEAFNLEVTLDRSGSNCGSQLTIELIVEDESEVVHSESKQRFIPPPFTDDPNYVMAFNDIILAKGGSFTLTVTLKEISVETFTIIDVTSADNDPPQVTDLTHSSSLEGLRKGDSVTFEAEFKDAKFTPKVECMVVIDGDEYLMELSESKRGEINYSQGKEFQFVWKSEAGIHQYKIVGTDGALSDETSLVDFKVSNVTGNNGVVWGRVTEDGSGNALEAATVEITSLDGENIYNLSTDANGRYEKVLGYGTYWVEANKDGYDPSGVKRAYIKEAEFDIELNFILTPEDANLKYGHVKGYVTTLADGNSKGVAGANVTLIGVKHDHSNTTEADTGYYALENIPTGDYELVVDKEGYEVEKRSVELTERTIWLNFTISEEGNGDDEPEGSIKVSVRTPPDAKVYLDDELQHPSELPNIYIIDVKFEEGGTLYVLRVEADGFETFTKTINVTNTSLIRIPTIDLVEMDGDFQNRIGPIEDGSGNAISGVTVNFTYNGIVYSNTTDTKGFAHFPGGLNLKNLKGEFEIFAEKGEIEIEWTHGETIPPFESKGSNGGNGGNGDNGSGEVPDSAAGLDQLYIWIGIIVIIAAVLVFVITFILKKRGEEDYDHFVEDEEYDEVVEEEEEDLFAELDEKPEVKDISLPDTVTCSSCGNAVPKGTAFCTGCGNSMKGEKTVSCNSCGAQVPKGNAFCTKCGMKMSEEKGGQLPSPTSGKVVQQLPSQTGGAEGKAQKTEQLPPPAKSEMPQLPPGPGMEEDKGETSPPPPPPA